MNTLNTVCDEINKRLFNHKPFIEGEIRFMVNQFEQLRDDQEINQLFQTLQRITDFKESQIDSAFKSCNQLNALNDSVDSVDNLMKQILSIESNEMINRNNYFRDKRIERSKQLSEFVELMKSQINEIDISFEEKENNLKKYYKDLEVKLKISPNNKT